MLNEIILGSISQVSKFLKSPFERKCRVATFMSSIFCIALESLLFCSLFRKALKIKANALFLLRRHIMCV